MSGKNINFDDKKIKRSEFYKKKKVTEFHKIDVDKIVSKEEPYGTKNSFKYSIGYKDNDVIKPLCIRLPQIIDYAKKLEFNSTMSFKISDKELLKKFDQMWKTIEKLLKIKFDSKPIYGDDEKYIKTKIKTYGDSVITNFHNKKVPKEKAPCICLSIIMLDFIIKAKKKYYQQTFLEECKYEQKRIKIENFIDDDLEKSESDESDNETESEEQFVKSILMQIVLIIHY